MISRLLGFAASVLVARMLGPGEFGALGMVQSTVGIFGALAGFGLGMTATKYVAEFRKVDSLRTGRIVLLSSRLAWVTSMLMTALVVGLAPWLAERSLGAPHLAPVLRIGALLLLLGGVTGAQSGAMAGFEAFRTIAVVNTIAGVLAFPIMVGGVWWWHLEGATWGLVGSLAVNAVLNSVALRRLCRQGAIPLSPDRWWLEWPAVVRFSLPAMFSILMLGPVNWACQAMLVNVPDGYGLMGVFNAALRIKQLPEMVLGMLMGPLLPVLSETYSKRDGHSYGRASHLAFAVSVGLVAAPALLQTAVPWLTLWVYGPSYAGHDVLVKWMMLHGVLVGLYWPFGSIIASMGRMWFGFAFNSVNSGCYLLMSWFLIPRYQAAGLAAAYAITQLVTSIPCLVYIFRREPDMVRGVPLFRWTAIVLALYVLCAVVQASGVGGWQALLTGTAAGGCVLWFATDAVMGQAQDAHGHRNGREQA